MVDVPSSSDSENPEIDFKNLNFGELEKTFQEVRELAKNTFHQTEDGFVNALGSGIGVHYNYGRFCISGVSEDLRDVHAYLCSHRPSDVYKGCDTRNKEEVMRAVKAMLEELGKRVIE